MMTGNAIFIVLMIRGGNLPKPVVLVLEKEDMCINDKLLCFFCTFREERRCGLIKADALLHFLLFDVCEETFTVNPKCAAGEYSPFNPEMMKVNARCRSCITGCLGSLKKMSPNPEWNKGYLILRWSASLLSANALIFEHQKLLMLPHCSSGRFSLKLIARRASTLSREYRFYWWKDAHCVVCFLHFQMSYNSYETALRGIDQIVMTNAYGPHKIIYVCFF